MSKINFNSQKLLVYLTLIIALVSLIISILAYSNIKSILGSRSSGAGTLIISDYEIVSQEVEVPPRSSTGIAALCPKGKKIIGGGCKPDLANANVLQSYPLTTDNSWNCLFQHIYPVDSYKGTAYAICARVE
jgi:hypothetical protein